MGARIARIIEATGLSQKEFGERVGVKPAHVTNWVKGYHEPSRGTLLSIAREYKVSEEWLTTGSGEMYVKESDVPYDFTVPHVSIPRATLPVVGYVSAGKLDVVWTDAGFPAGHGFDEVEKPEWLRDPNSFALRVKGESMYPPFTEGTTIIVDTKAQVVNRDMIICRVKSLEAYWKIYSERAGMVTLESVNPGVPAMTFRKEEILYKYKVVQILPPRRRN